MSTSNKGFSFRSIQHLSYFKRQSAKDAEEISELQIQLNELKVILRSRRVKLVDLKQEIRLLNSLVYGGKHSFYQRRLEKFIKAHEITEGETEKYKIQIDLIGSRINELNTPSFLRTRTKNQIG